jgi:curved DNA-binding protein CbpA
MTYKPQEGVDYIVDLYAVAGTERDAAEADIKTALNGRAMEYHPDRLEGLAPEFLEKGERIAKLLNRARGILLDTDKRFEYDGILSSWEGPLSTDGTPIISMSRIQEVKFRDESPEQVEMHFRAYQIAIRSHTGYSPNRLDFLEQMLEQSGDDVSEELRSEYEDALLQKDRALAIEEAERSKLLGMPEIEEQNYAATLNYGEETAVKIDEARRTFRARYRFKCCKNFRASSLLRIAICKSSGNSQ